MYDIIGAHEQHFIFYVLAGGGWQIENNVHLRSNLPSDHSESQ